MVGGAELDGVVGDLRCAFEGGRFGEPVVVGWEVDDNREDLLGWGVDCD